MMQMLRGYARKAPLEKIHMLCARTDNVKIEGLARRIARHGELQPPFVMKLCKMQRPST